MNLSWLKPTIIKVLLSVLAIAVVWWLAFNSTIQLCARVDCVLDVGVACTAPPLVIIPLCCGCYTWSSLAKDILGIFVIPFAVMYLIVSLVQYGQRKNENNNYKKIF